MGAFRFPQHRQEYLVAHALLRSCLSRYGERQPWEWEFSANPYGRPEIQVESGSPTAALQSVPHTTGLVTCPVTPLGGCGGWMWSRTTRQGDFRCAIASL